MKEMEKLKINWLKTRLENAIKEQNKWREVEIECRDKIRQIQSVSNRFK